MIGYLSGTVKGVVRDTIIVETGGVGYRLFVLAGTISKTKEGESLSLWTHLAVRENAQDLYGFETRDELQWFELLLSVSGIGPRSARGVMNSADIQTLRTAVASNDAGLLTSVAGIGKKTAEKIVLELSEKVELGEGGATAGSDGEVVEALVGLGYSAKEARDAARAVSKEVTGTESRVREALRLASGSK